MAPVRRRVMYYRTSFIGMEDAAKNCQIAFVLLLLTNVWAKT